MMMNRGVAAAVLSGGRLLTIEWRWILAPSSIHCCLSSAAHKQQFIQIICSNNKNDFFYYILLDRFFNAKTSHPLPPCSIHPITRYISCYCSPLLFMLCTYKMAIAGFVLQKLLPVFSLFTIVQQPFFSKQRTNQKKAKIIARSTNMKETQVTTTD